MTIFRHKKNRLLYTIIQNCGRYGSAYEAHPYNHTVEVGIIQKRRFRKFKVNMNLSDFEAIAYT
jgi:hypothetical protein